MDVSKKIYRLSVSRCGRGSLNRRIKWVEGEKREMREKILKETTINKGYSRGFWKSNTVEAS